MQNASGYGSTKDGQMLTQAFVTAFNAIVGQQSVLTSMPTQEPAAAASSSATVAVNTSMLAEPSVKAAALRSLREGTKLNPTGKRNGLFIEVTDNFGTKGWVSVENLK